MKIGQEGANLVLKETKQELQNKVAELQKTCDKINSEIEENRNIILSLYTNNVKEQEKLDTKTELVKSLNKEIKGLKEEINSKLDNFKSIERHRLNDIKKLDSDIKSLKSIKKDYDSYSKKNNDLKTKNKTKLAELVKINDEVEDAKLFIKEIEARLENIKIKEETIDKVKEQYKLRIKEMTKREQELNKREASIKKLYKDKKEKWVELR